MNLGIASIPGLRRDLLAMGILATSGNLAVGIINPIMPLYLDSIGIEPQIIGFLASVAAGAIGLGEFFWGWASDRVHLRLPMAFGTLGLAIVLFSFTLTQALPMLYLLFFFRGITLAAIFPTGRGFIGATMDVRQKALFLAIFSTVLGFGNAFGALTGGFIARELGFTTAFIVASFFAVSGGILGVALLRAKRLTEYAPAQTTERSGVQDSRKPKGRETASLKTQAIMAMLVFTSIGVIITFVPLLAKRVLFMEPSDVGLIFAISGLFGMILPIPIGKLSDRFGRRPLMALGLIISGLAAAEIAFANSFQTLLVFVSLRQIGMSTFQPAAVALFSDTASSERQGIAMGVYGMCEDAGIVIGPAVGGYVWENLGPQPTFWFAAAPSLAAAVIAISKIRRVKAEIPITPYP